MEDSLAALAGDLNGDGEAIALVNDYTVAFDGQPENSDMQTAGVMQLTTDFSGGVSCLYVVENAEGFLSWYSGQTDEADARLWKECPALVGLDAGVYSVVEDIDTNHTGQELLAEYMVFPALQRAEEIKELLKLP